MKINEMIKKKRQELELTQGYIAEYLGVSVQAVSKWEKGATYPDIMLLPVLARLLNIDLNTLFSFNDSLTEFEINQFIVHELMAKMKDPQDYEEVFKTGIAKIHKYPNCEILARDVAVVLEQFLSVYGIENRELYQESFDKIFDKLANSQDIDMRNETILMRIPTLIAEKKYEKAEMMINLLPNSPFDKRVWHAEVYLKQERYAEAAKIYEEKLIDLVQDLHHVLWGLSLTSIHQKQDEHVAFYVKTYEKVMELFDWPQIAVLNTQLDIEMAKKDADKEMELIRKLLEAVKEINAPSENIYRKLCYKYNEERVGAQVEDINDVEEITKRIIKQIKSDSEFERIRNHTDFERLILEFDKEMKGEK